MWTFATVHVHAGPAVDVSAEATVDVDAGAANDGALEPAPGIAGLDPVCGTRLDFPCVIQVRGCSRLVFY